MKLQRSIRLISLVGFLLSISLLLFVYYLQTHGVIPCPLCVLQRIAYMGIGIVFFIGIFCTRSQCINMLLGAANLLLSLAGLILAGRQTWLQYAPPTTDGGCGVSLSYLLNVLPITDAANMIWQGGAECSELGWVFLHLSMAEWSVIFFGLFFIFAILQLTRGMKL